MMSCSVCQKVKWSTAKAFSGVVNNRSYCQVVVSKASVPINHKGHKSAFNLKV